MQEKIDCPNCHATQMVEILGEKSATRIYAPCQLCECVGYIYWTDLYRINTIRKMN